MELDKLGLAAWVSSESSKGGSKFLKRECRMDGAALWTALGRPAPCIMSICDVLTTAVVRGSLLDWPLVVIKDVLRRSGSFRVD